MRSFHKARAYWGIGANLRLGPRSERARRLTAQPVLAEDAAAGENIWGRFSTIMQDVYGELVAISTIVAVTVASIALINGNYYYLYSGTQYAYWIKTAKEFILYSNN